MKRKGYLWNFYGYTQLHLWGVHVVSSMFAMVGTIFLILAISKLVDGAPVPRVVAHLTCAGIAFLGCIAVVAASILSLLFFWGAHQLQLPEENPDEAV